MSDAMKKTLFYDLRKEELMQEELHQFPLLY